MLALYLSMVSDEEGRRKITLIYQKYRKYMMFRANEVLNNKNDAEDAVHDAMLKIISVIERVDTSDALKLKAFCGIVAENAAKTKKRKHGPDNVMYNDSYAVSKTETDIPDEIIYRKEVYDIVSEAIIKMTPHYRNICMLKFLYGYTDMEISGLLDINDKTVSSAASRGRQIIKDALKEAYPDEWGDK